MATAPKRLRRSGGNNTTTKSTAEKAREAMRKLRALGWPARIDHALAGVEQRLGVIGHNVDAAVDVAHEVRDAAAAVLRARQAVMSLPADYKPPKRSRKHIIPQVGQRVTVKAKYAAVYGVPEGAELLVQGQAGKNLKLIVLDRPDLVGSAAHFAPKP